ncbi:putative galactose oxidase/kelch, beta-propeller, galactose oxidase, beta-propeller [Rosa chinensis]|uniref:Putative galactose oxidase/kelch, beta-propeller, galactose oxidase, beta-propeller n=1 Tax=Rosa chinensis TaxID=74649 RepID=A0A2P6QDE2_ROSCH|nr:putative galactose oxidase/kelch, beta-propeller, galactose oxidase, beta-propeller [Rosa chinensis]
MSTLCQEKKAFIPDDHRSLYLCFGEYEEGSKVSYTILSASLHQLFYACSSPRQLQLVTRFSGEGLPRYVGCGLWGSKILLGGGAKPAYLHCPSRGQPASGCFIHHEVRKIYCFETTEETQVPMPLPKKMLKGNIQPLLVEVNGKLYALGKSLPSFEMFDGNDWSELAPPPHGTYLCYPFTHSDPACQFDVYYAVAGTNILVSDGGSSFRFDTSDPKQGWRRLISADQFSFDPFCFKGTSVVVNDGKQFVLFTFQPSDGQHISVHLIAYDFDSITQDYSRVPLAPYLMEYKDDRLGDLPLPNYRLVHIGDNAVCLLMSKLLPNGVDERKKKMIRCVEFAAFTFKVRDNTRLSLKIRFLPHTSKLIYDDDNDDDMDMASRTGQMLGAFLLENSQVNKEDLAAEH